MQSFLPITQTFLPHHSLAFLFVEPNLLTLSLSALSPSQGSSSLTHQSRKPKLGLSCWIVRERERHTHTYNKFTMDDTVNLCTLTTAPTIFVVDKSPFLLKLRFYAFAFASHQNGLCHLLLLLKALHRKKGLSLSLFLFTDVSCSQFFAIPLFQSPTLKLNVDRHVSRI